MEDLVLYLTYGQDDLRKDKPFVAMVIMLGSKRYQLPSASDLGVVDDQNVAVSACAFPHHLSSEEREQEVFHRYPELLVRLQKAELKISFRCCRKTFRTFPGRSVLLVVQ